MAKPLGVWYGQTSSGNPLAQALVSQPKSPVTGGKPRKATPRPFLKPGGRGLGQRTAELDMAPGQRLAGGAGRGVFDQTMPTFARPPKKMRPAGLPRPQRPATMHNMAAAISSRMPAWTFGTGATSHATLPNLNAGQDALASGAKEEVHATLEESGVLPTSAGQANATEAVAEVQSFLADAGGSGIMEKGIALAKAHPVVSAGIVGFVIAKFFRII